MGMIHMRLSKQKIFQLLFLSTLTLATVYYYSTSGGGAFRPVEALTMEKYHFHPPGRPKTIEESSDLKLKYLEKKLISQIESLSNPISCENMSILYCGNYAKCGLGCELHHRAACLMLSYSMGMPLIHDKTAWPFETWENIFQPLGSGCPVNERTITLTWTPYHLPTLSALNGSKVQYPFISGIPVDGDFLQAIKGSNHPDPFLWFVGQFVKYTMRLSSKIAPTVRDFVSKLPRTTTIVGLHIRRTDRITNNRDSLHEIRDYMSPADAYFQGLNYSGSRTVYLASDDHTLLAQSQKLYPPPKWRFIGLEMNKTFPDEESRRNPQALMSIIQDIMALTKCDHVICGLNSNVCRLLLELNSAEHMEGPEHVTSLERKYALELRGHFVPTRLIPVNSAWSSF